MPTTEVRFEYEYRNEATNWQWQRAAWDDICCPPETQPMPRNRTEARQFLAEKVKGWTADTQMRFVKIVIRTTHSGPISVHGEAVS